MDDYVCSMCGESIEFDETNVIPFSCCGCKPNLKTKEVPVNITQEEYDRGIKAYLSSKFEEKLTVSKPIPVKENCGSCQHWMKKGDCPREKVTMKGESN